MRGWGGRVRHEVRLYCDLCADEMLFETPPCVDGHGADCPELACTGCGTALVVAPLAVAAPGRERTGGTRGGAGRRAPRERRAA